MKSPIFRFKEDPVHALILETLNKKPVNSEHFSLVKRIKLSDYTKGPVASENLDSVANRSREYMNQAGFAYGRLQEKNWTSGEAKQETVRINAPGPVLNKLLEEKEEDNEEFNDNFQSKIVVRFQKIKIAPLDKSYSANCSKPRGNTTRPMTRISASQRQAREYLNYLNALNSNEHSYINTQISQKTKELEEKFGAQAKKREDKLNFRGVFSAELNRERVKSMVPVKMQSKIKTSIEPFIRNAKDVVMKEKFKEGQENTFDRGNTATADTTRKDRNDKLLDIVERAITKNINRSKKKEVSVASAKKKIKMHWIDRLNQTMEEVKVKTKPDERLMNIGVL